MTWYFFCNKVLTADRFLITPQKPLLWLAAFAISCLMRTFSEAISAAVLSSRNSDSASNSTRRTFSSAARSRADEPDFRDRLEVFELDDAELDDFPDFLSP